MTLRALLIFVAASVLCPATGFAQEEEGRVRQQREPWDWGIVVSYAPRWRVPNAGPFALWFDPALDGFETDIGGSDFRIGLARSRWPGADWGFNYVRRSIDDGATNGKGTEQCDSQGCSTRGDFYTYRNASIVGLEVYRFLPFVTIAERVQLGLNVSGGVGIFRGKADYYRYNPGFLGSPPNAQRTNFAPTERTVDAFKAGTPILPLGKLEVAAAVMAVRGVRIRVGGGLDYPGFPVFSVSGVYLFSSE